MKVDPPVGSRPSGAKAWLLQNCTIIFVSAVVNFHGLVMCYTTKKQGGVATYISMSELQHTHPFNCPLSSTTRMSHC